MESLAKLIMILFLIIYFIALSFEVLGLVYLIKNYLPSFGGWWYCLWMPILISANYFVTILILIILSKINLRG